MRTGRLAIDSSADGAFWNIVPYATKSLPSLTAEMNACMATGIAISAPPAARVWVGWGAFGPPEMNSTSRPSSA
ncbi:hypothetical protein BJF78_09950 [Pseudonocardia sp. CNS-139]|nr:hypothetical protein BJF78_09950 [Pseudonocardia sp. CNS-139]